MKPLLTSTLVTSLASLAALSSFTAACGDNETPPPEKGAYQASPATPLPCVPNLDGKIEAKELAPQVGIPATYLVNPSGKDRTVDLAGRTNAQGKLSWAFGVDFADDTVAKVAAQRLDGKWYAASFAAVKNPVVVALDLGGRTEGVYTHDDSGFYLHGLASVTPDAPEGKTLLVYASPVMLYRFPLEPGATWTSVGTTTKENFLRGLPYAGRDIYEMKVDGAGELGLPDYVLTQALRVRTKLTVEPAAGQVTTQRQVGFLFECLGEVTRATSKLNEPEENFTAAAELRRLGIAP
jgi:hypothetical protein